MTLLAIASGGDCIKSVTMPFSSMISVQPTGLHHYLTTQRLVTPQNLRRLFYSSWEDALWDLLLYFEIPKNSLAMVPEFFCGDVVNNMKQHGLNSIWYPCDENFQTDPKVFKNWLLKHKPQVVIILHAVGITNQLLAKKDTWLSALPPNAILIEDSVHRIVNPQNIRLIAPRHVVMDSLRKVVPLPGSNLYGDNKVLAQLHPTAWWKTVPYQLQVFGWWLIFQILLALKLNTIAEKAMLAGYDVIGDSYVSGAGWPIARSLAYHLDITKIEESKQRQVALYKKYLSPLWEDERFFAPTFSHTDSGKLRGFPVALRPKTADSILAKLRAKGILVRFELNDSVWSQKNKVVYLPLGPYLSNSEVISLAQTVRVEVAEVSSSG